MAKLIIDETTLDIADGSKFVKEAESAGIPFGCTEGICGSCLVEVEEGMENLTEPTQEEKDFEIEDKQRLACQCVLKQNSVKLKYF
ncbi:MAG: ferredoxin [Candidatus Woesearchaeota archaeon]|jgi:ferredoxin